MRISAHPWTSGAAAIVVVASLLLVGVVPAFASDYFSDVEDGDPFHDEISRLFELDITTGFPVEEGDPEFRPTLNITRQAVIAFAFRAAGSPAGEFTENFTDVAPGDPFYDAIAWAASNGITKGFKDNTFRPTNEVTREAFTSFLYEANGAPTGTFTENFKDVDEENEFFTAIAWASTNKIILGFKDGTFRPSNKITRQAVAALLVKFVDGGFDIEFDDQGIPGAFRVADIDGLNADDDAGDERFDVRFAWSTPQDLDDALSTYQVGIGTNGDGSCGTVTPLSNENGPDGITDDQTAEGSPFSNGTKTITATVFDVPAGSYCAQVRTAYTDGSFSGWSRFVSFTIDDGTPKRFALTQGPADLDGDADDADVRYRWDAVSNAVSYDVGFGIDTNIDGGCKNVSAVTVDDGVNGATNDDTDDAAPYNTTDDGQDFPPGSQTALTINDVPGGEYCARVRAVFIDGSTSRWSFYEPLTVESDDQGVPRGTTAAAADRDTDDIPDLNVEWTKPNDPDGTIVSYDVDLAIDQSADGAAACTTVKRVTTSDGVDGQTDDGNAEAAPYNTGGTATSEVLFDVPDNDYCARVRTVYANGAASGWSSYVAVTVAAGSGMPGLP